MADTTLTITLPANTPPDRVQSIVDALGPDVAVQTAAAAGAPAVKPGAFGGIDAAVERMIVASRTLPDLIAQASREVQAASGHSIFGIVMISLGVLLAAYAAERLLRLVTPSISGHASAAFSARLGAAAMWGLARLGSLAAFAVIAVVINRMLIPAGMPRQIFAMVGTVVLVQRVLYTVLCFIAAPGDAPRRLVPWSDEQSRKVAGALAVQIFIVGALRMFSGVVSKISGGGPADDGAQVATSLIWWLVVTAFFFIVRDEFALLVRRGAGEKTRVGRWLTSHARAWPFIATLLAFAVSLGEISQILTSNHAAAFGFVFLIFFLTPFVLAGLGALKSEMTESAAPEKRAQVAGWFALAEGGVLVLAVVLLLYQWDIDPFAKDHGTGLAALAPALVSVLCVGIAGWATWRATVAFIAAYEPKNAADDDTDGDSMGREGSRLGTALPIIRGFVFVFILSVTVMIALSAMGVNIGPMIAGAGIFGLAIGFGSQKLVADVISGIFYLYEDAFRVGEYVVTKEGKGLVERISIRSARLRHHLGPIYTIPFSSMGTIQNHSRDWVKIKFTFDVPAGTDLEKVRKVVKKVGVKLLEDPELESKFLEPMKSQGAVAIKGAGYEIGVKYMCKPGQQFLIRRKAFAALQDAFKANDIQLMRPTITLNNPDDPGVPTIAQPEKA